MPGIVVLSLLHAASAAEVDLGTVVVAARAPAPWVVVIPSLPAPPAPEGLPGACAGLPGAARPDPDPAVEDAAAACLEAAGGLSAGGWMRLGELRQGRAYRGWLAAQAAADACWASGAASCAEVPPPDLGPAHAAWAKVGPEAPVAVRAWVGAAEGRVYVDEGRLTDAARAFRAADLEGAAPGLRAYARYGLGDALRDVDPAGADNAWGAAIALGPSPAAVAARFARASSAIDADRVADALVDVWALTRVDDPAAAAEARRWAPMLVARLGPGAAAAVQAGDADPAVRASVGADAARSLAADGHLTWARAVASSARALDPAVQVDVPASGAETADAWARRVAAWCAPTAPGAMYSLLLGVSKAGPHATAALGGLASTEACLAERLPPPEGPLRGKWRIAVQVAP